MLAAKKLWLLDGGKSSGKKLPTFFHYILFFLNLYKLHSTLIFPALPGCFPVLCPHQDYFEFHPISFPCPRSFLVSFHIKNSAILLPSLIIQIRFTSPYQFRSTPSPLLLFFRFPPVPYMIHCSFIRNKVLTIFVQGLRPSHILLIYFTYHILTSFIQDPSIYFPFQDSSPHSLKFSPNTTIIPHPCLFRPRSFSALLRTAPIFHLVNVCSQLIFFAG